MPITGFANTLLDSMAERCIPLEKKVTQDGLGGYKTTWTDGIAFSAAIRKDDQIQTRIAEKQGLTEFYTVVVQKGFPVAYHDVFRRVSDGLTYRFTSDIKDKGTPAVSRIGIGVVYAERWNLPDV